MVGVAQRSTGDFGDLDALGASRLESRAFEQTKKENKSS